VGGRETHISPTHTSHNPPALYGNSSRRVQFRKLPYSKNVKAYSSKLPSNENTLQNPSHVPYSSSAASLIASSSGIVVQVACGDVSKDRRWERISDNEAPPRIHSSSPTTSSLLPRRMTARILIRSDRITWSSCKYCWHCVSSPGSSERRCLIGSRERLAFPSDTPFLSLGPIFVSEGIYLLSRLAESRGWMTFRKVLQQSICRKKMAVRQTRVSSTPMKKVLIYYHRISL